MKAIKFNLSYGNKRIKTLAELEENCDIDMLLETLDNGLLVRWLTAQGKSELAEKVGVIDKSDYRKATKELLTVLFGKDASVLEQAAAELFAVREKEAARLESLKNLASKENEIIEQHHAGYNDTLSALKESANDYPKLKALMITLNSQYRELLKLDASRFYNDFKDGYPLVLLALMANTNLRGFLSAAYNNETVYDDVLPQLSIEPSLINIKNKIAHGEPSPAVYIETDEQLREFQDKYGEKEFGYIYKTSSGNYTTKIITASRFAVNMWYVPLEAISVGHIKTFNGETDAYWKDIEPKGKTFMIISIKSGNKLRNAGANGEELTADDINGKFIFTDGIDYMSNSDSDKLIYMEV